MSEAETPLILYVPGLLPKPAPALHSDALARCLLTGVERLDDPVADSIRRNAGSFDVVSWTFDFYGEHRDFGLDAEAIEDVVEQTEASPRDIAEARSWGRRITQWVYRLGDRLPFLIPHLVNERTEVHLRDLRRYLKNDNGCADHTRRMLKMPLRAAAESGRPVLLIGHSMGSVIAWDSLWELAHVDRAAVEIDLLLTMGSPLGQRYIQRRLKGADREGRARFPDNIRRWRNLSAIGELTAFDPWLANDFADIVQLGMVESLEDAALYNYFRLFGELNVHSEYGYLVNAVTARTVADWWRGHVELPPRC